MKRLELLDYGRFFAALIVIAFHYTFNGIANGKIDSINHIPSLIEVTKYGYIGVELFFMISGYVIFYSAKNRTAAKFAESRAIRLYPAYWFAILFTSFFAFLWGGDLMSVYPSQIIANLTMMQSFVGISHVDGVYWTLAYELTFYFAVFTILFLGLQNHLNSIFIFWPVLFCIGIVTGLESKLYLGGYYYFFCAGALFALLAEKYNIRAVLSLLTTYVLCLYFSVSQASNFTESKGVEYSETVIAAIITLFFLLFVFQNSTKGRSLSLPMSRITGALTYPIYLIHAHFGYMFLSQYATEENKLTAYALTFFIVLLTALAIHLIIEKQLHFVWEKFFHYTINRPINLLQKLTRKVQLAFMSRTN